MLLGISVTKLFQTWPVETPAGCLMCLLIFFFIFWAILYFA